MQHICKSFGRGFISTYVCAAVFILMCCFSADAETVDEQLQKMNKRLDRLEVAKQPKMLAPHKDVDFLFESVVGDTYDTSLTFAEAITIKGFDRIFINKIKITTRWFEDNTTELFNNEGKGISPSDLSSLINGGLYFMTTEAKMQAVERTLGLTATEPDLIKRIDRAYVKINNKDWQNDDLRFGVLTSYLSDANAVATSVAVHSYFGYRRFTPGKLDLHNFGRRFSGFFAVGTGNAMDSSSGKSADIKDPVLSVGIGFDIVKGFVLSAGVSIFSYKAPADQDYNLKNSPTFGITLNSDLWRALFNDK